MDYETIEKTIELLCEKFGIAITSVESLIPSVVNYRLGVDTVMLIISAILIVVSICLSLKARKSKENYELILCAIIAGGMGIGALMLSVNDIMKWIYMPEVAFIEHVAGYLE